MLFSQRKRTKCWLHRVVTINVFVSKVDLLEKNNSRGPSTRFFYSHFRLIFIRYEPPLLRLYHKF